MTKINPMNKINLLDSIIDYLENSNEFIDGNDIEEDKDDLLGRTQCFPKGCIIEIKTLHETSLIETLIPSN